MYTINNILCICQLSNQQVSLSLLFSSLYYIGISHTMYSVYTQHTVHVDLMHPHTITHTEYMYM